MKKKFGFLGFGFFGFGCLLLLLAAAPPLAAQEHSSGYKIVNKINVGGEGFWDYLIADAANHRLYVSHGMVVKVIDTEKNTVIGEIPNTPGVHGIALAPEIGHGFTSNGREGTVTVFDLKTLATLATIKVTGENPDSIVYDPVSKRVFTFNGRSSNATAIDATTDKVVGTIPLDGRPEFSVSDGRGRMYVNLESKSALLAFDAKSLKIEGEWPLAPCEEPSGLAIDRQHRRLFAGCHNQMMAIVNADTGKVMTTVPIGRGVDANNFDPGTQFAFSSNGDGTLTVVHEDSPDKYTVVDNVATQRSARTMALDEVTHRIYLSAAEFGPPPAATAQNPRPRPTIVPGSFTVLVLAR